MARLMRYMINYQGRKLFSTLSIKLSKPVIYNLAPLILERVDTGRVSQCGISVANSYPIGVRYLYTDDGTEPTMSSPELPSVIEKNCTIKAIAVVEYQNRIEMSASAGVLVIDDLRVEMSALTLSGDTIPPVYDEGNILGYDGYSLGYDGYQIGYMEVN